MAYGVKYIFEFLATNGDSIQILLLQKGWTGISMNRALGRAPKLKREKSGCIYGTSLEFYAECQTEGEFASLYTSSADEFKIEVYKTLLDGSSRKKLWEGFVTPELYSEPEIAAPYDVQIIATDGLGELKNFDFNSKGSKTIRGHIEYLLSYTGLVADCRVISDLKCDGFNMMDIVLDLSHKAGSSCYDVLKELLNSFNSSITFQGSDWLIWRNTDLVTKLPEINFVDFGSKTVAEWWPIGQLSATIIPACKEVTVVSENSYKSNVLEDIATDLLGDASFDETQQCYILPHQEDAIVKFLNLEEEVGYKLSLAVTARNVGSGQDEQPITIKVEIVGRSYAAGNKFWLVKMPNGSFALRNHEGVIEESMAAPAQSDDASNAETFEMVLPLYKYDNRSYHYATSVKVTISNESGVYPIHVYDVSLIKTAQVKGYKSVLTLANGAREEFDEVEVSVASSEKMPAAARIFMNGIAVDGDGNPIQQWGSNRINNAGYLSFISQDYALMCALPRMQVQGVLNVPSSALEIPILFKRDNTYYFPEKYEYDLLNDELVVMLVSISTAIISVTSEKITELAAEKNVAGGSGGTSSSGITVDLEMSDDSANPIANKIIKKYVDDLLADYAKTAGNHNIESDQFSIKGDVVLQRIAEDGDTYLNYGPYTNHSAKLYIYGKEILVNADSTKIYGSLEVLYGTITAQSGLLVTPNKAIRFQDSDTEESTISFDSTKGGLNFSGATTTKGTASFTKGIEIAAGQTISFVDSNGVKHQIAYDEEKGAIKFIGDFYTTGENGAGEAGESINA